jgi:pimeloyl-ACP methyl ester carboxylesterase
MTACSLDLSDGVRFLVRRHGKPEAPRILIGHGTGFAVDGFRRMWEPLCDTFDVFVYDLRHHGSNDPCPPESITAERQNDDLREILSGLRENFGEKPVFGLFHSISGLAALRVESLAPRLFAGLVLMEPPVPPPAGHPLAEAFDQARRMLAERTVRRQARFTSLAELAGKYRDRPAFALFEDGAAEMLAAAIAREDADGWTLRCPPEAESRYYATNHDDGLMDRLDRIACPVLLLAGRGDLAHPGTPAQIAVQLARLGGFDLLELANATHMMPLERPRTIAEATRAFVRNITGSV